MKSLPLALGAAFAIYGCTSVAPTGTPAPPAPSDQRAAMPAGLTAERQWLQSWFQGTPVLIAQRADGAVNVDVPREFCFDPGRSNVKPALAAVLDKMAESLRRVPLARVSLLAAPDDGTATARLALERALQVQKVLISRGVPAARIAKPTATPTAAVQLRIEVPPL